MSPYDRLLESPELRAALAGLPGPKQDQVLAAIVSVSHQEQKERSTVPAGRYRGPISGLTAALSA